MTYSPIAPGTPNWDVPVNAAFTSQDGRITANEATDAAQNVRLNQLEASVFEAVDAGWLAWNYDPLSIQGSTGLTTGVLFMARIDLPVAATVSTLYYAINTAGVGLTSGQNLAGLYDSSGNLLAQTADQSGNWNTLGFKSTSLVSGVPLSAGTYYLGFLSNASTTPAGLLRSSAMGSQATTVNVNLPNATARWTTTGSGLTALPSPVTMSGRTTSSGTVWVAIG